MQALQAAASIDVNQDLTDLQQSNNLINDDGNEDWADVQDEFSGDGVEIHAIRDLIGTRCVVDIVAATTGPV